MADTPQKDWFDRAMAWDLDAAIRRAGCLPWVLLFALAVWLLGDPAPDQPVAPPVAELSAAQVADCRKLLAEAQRIGLIREMTSGDRIEVDERLWAELPHKSKQGTLAALSCATWRRAVPPKGEIAAAYGWRDGKRKAMWTEVGMID
jgi:hypothetical protein